jgi:hypothetical protein
MAVYHKGLGSISLWSRTGTPNVPNAMTTEAIRTVAVYRRGVPSESERLRQEYGVLRAASTDVRMQAKERAVELETRVHDMIDGIDAALRAL